MEVSVYNSLTGLEVSYTGLSKPRAMSLYATDGSRFASSNSLGWLLRRKLRKRLTTDAGNSSFGGLKTEQNVLVQRCELSTISRDFGSHFKWRHLMTKGKMPAILDIKHVFVVITVPADGLAPLGARTSTGTVMTKLDYCTYIWWVKLKQIDKFHQNVGA